MPLDKPPLRLGTDPRAVHEARRWVVAACDELDRHELVECAELGISELVTNALLHSSGPITVRLRGTVIHPRVEVADSSPEPPVLNPVDLEDPEDLLSTFGRGMNIVARCSVSWGASIEPDGKVVWFEPAPAPHQDDVPAGALFDLHDLPQARLEPQFPARVLLTSVPVHTALGLRQHYHDLRREVRLLALAHEEDYPLARQLSSVFHRFDQVFPGEVHVQLEEAAARGAEVADVDVLVDGHHAGVFEQMLRLLDLADEFCRAQRLLSLARTPEQLTFQQWYLGEFIRQSRGERPVAWSARRTPVRAGK